MHWWSLCILAVLVICAAGTNAPYPVAGCWEQIAAESKYKPLAQMCVQYFGFQNSESAVDVTIPHGFDNYLLVNNRPFDANLPVSFPAQTDKPRAFNITVPCARSGGAATEAASSVRWTLNDHVALSVIGHPEHHCGSKFVAAINKKNKHKKKKNKTPQAVSWDDAHVMRDTHPFRSEQNLQCTQVQLSQDVNNGCARFPLIAADDLHSVKVLDIQLSVNPHGCSRTVSTTPLSLGWALSSGCRSAPMTHQDMATLGVPCALSDAWFGLDWNSRIEWPAVDAINTALPDTGLAYRPPTAQDELTKSLRHALIAVEQDHVEQDSMFVQLYASGDSVSGIVRSATLRLCTKSTQPQQRTNVRSASGPILEPIFDCTSRIDATQCVSFFGYNLRSKYTQHRPVGPANTFSEAPFDRGQPVRFRPGEHHNVFSVVWNCSTVDGQAMPGIVWLTDGAATANRRMPICRIGCDGSADGNKQYDQCGVCGGDGSSCRHVPRSYSQLGSDGALSERAYCDYDNERFNRVNFDDSISRAILDADKRSASFAWKRYNLTVSANRQMMIVDSSNPPDGRSDIGTPNTHNGGPGTGTGGAASNTEPLGLVLAFDSPDAASVSSGCMRFDFDRPSHVHGIQLLNVPSFCPDLSITGSGAQQGNTNNKYQVGTGLVRECGVDADCIVYDGSAQSCVGGRCVQIQIGRRQESPPSSSFNWHPPCDRCKKSSDCDDSRPCTADICVSGMCHHPRVFACCEFDDECPINEDRCLENFCSLEINRCETRALEECCSEQHPCPESQSACTEMVCVNNVCQEIPSESDGECCDSAEDCVESPCIEVSCIDNQCVAVPIPSCCTEEIACANGGECVSVECVQGECAYEPIENCCNNQTDCIVPNQCIASSCVEGQCELEVIAGCCNIHADCVSTDACVISSCNLETNQCVVDVVPGCCHNDSDCPVSDKACVHSFCNLTAEATGVCEYDCSECPSETPSVSLSSTPTPSATPHTCSGHPTGSADPSATPVPSSTPSMSPYQTPTVSPSPLNSSSTLSSSTTPYPSFFNASSPTPVPSVVNRSSSATPYLSSSPSPSSANRSSSVTPYLSSTPSPSSLNGSSSVTPYLSSTPSPSSLNRSSSSTPYISPTPIPSYVNRSSSVTPYLSSTPSPSPLNGSSSVTPYLSSTPYPSSLNRSSSVTPYLSSTPSPSSLNRSSSVTPYLSSSPSPSSLNRSSSVTPYLSLSPSPSPLNGSSSVTPYLSSSPSPSSLNRSSSVTPYLSSTPSPSSLNRSSSVTPYVSSTPSSSSSPGHSSSPNPTPSPVYSTSQYPTSSTTVYPTPSPTKSTATVSLSQIASPTPTPTTPPDCSFVCARGQGYWKTHPEKWDQTLEICNKTYSQVWVEFEADPVDRWLQLAVQWQAADLVVRSIDDPRCLPNDTLINLSLGREILEKYCNGSIAPVDDAYAEALKNYYENFVTGHGGLPSCDELERDHKRRRRHGDDGDDNYNSHGKQQKPHRRTVGRKLFSIDSPDSFSVTAPQQATRCGFGEDCEERRLPTRNLHEEENRRRSVSSTSVDDWDSTIRSWVALYDASGKRVERKPVDIYTGDNAVSTLRFGTAPSVASVEVCMCDGRGAVTQLDFDYPGSGLMVDGCGQCNGTGSECAYLPTDAVTADALLAPNPIIIRELDGPADDDSNYEICYIHRRVPGDDKDFSGSAVRVAFSAPHVCGLRAAGSCDSSMPVPDAAGQYCDMFGGPRAYLSNGWRYEPLDEHCITQAVDHEDLLDCPIGDGSGGYRLCTTKSFIEMSHCVDASGATAMQSHDNRFNNGVTYHGDIYAAEFRPLNCMSEKSCESVDHVSHRTFSVQTTVAGSTRFTLESSQYGFDAEVTGVSCMASGALRVAIVTHVQHVDQQVVGESTTHIDGVTIGQVTFDSATNELIYVVTPGNTDVRFDSELDTIRMSANIISSECDNSDDALSTQCTQYWTALFFDRDVSSFHGQARLGFDVAIRGQSGDPAMVTLHINAECNDATPLSATTASDSFSLTARNAHEATVADGMLTLYRNSAMTVPYSPSTPDGSVFIENSVVYARLQVVLPESLMMHEHVPDHIVLTEFVLCYSVDNADLFLPFDPEDPYATGCASPGNWIAATFVHYGELTSAGERVDFRYGDDPSIPLAINMSWASRAPTRHPVYVDARWKIIWLHSQSRSVTAEDMASVRLAQHRANAVRSGRAALDWEESHSVFHSILTVDQMRETRHEIGNRAMRDEARMLLATHNAMQAGMDGHELARLLLPGSKPGARVAGQMHLPKLRSDGLDLDRAMNSPDDAVLVASVRDDSQVYPAFDDPMWSGGAQNAVVVACKGPSQPQETGEPPVEKYCPKCHKCDDDDDRDDDDHYGGFGHQPCFGWWGCMGNGGGYYGWGYHGHDWDDWSWWWILILFLCAALFLLCLPLYIGGAAPIIDHGPGRQQSQRSTQADSVTVNTSGSGNVVAVHTNSPKRVGFRPRGQNVSDRKVNMSVVQ